MTPPNPERQLRTALVALLNARSAVRTAQSNALRRRAEGEWNVARNRVLALARNTPAHAALVRSLTSGRKDGIVAEDNLAERANTYDKRRKADLVRRANVFDEVRHGCQDDAAPNTPGTRRVPCERHNYHTQFVGGR